MAYLGKRQFYQELLVRGRPVIQIRFIAEIHGPIDEVRRTLGSRSGHSLAGFIVGFKENYC